MARQFDYSSSEHLSVTGMLGEPVTISCSVWVSFNAVLDSDGSSVISLGDNFGIIINDELSTGFIRGFWYDGSWRDIDDTSQDWKDSGWIHIVLVVNPSGSIGSRHKLYVNGSLSASSDFSNSINWGSNGSDTFIGKHADGGTTWDMSGDIAELAVWDSVLTADEVVSLAAGYVPSFVQPQNIIAYWPLIRDEDQDRFGGYDLTAVNTPTIAAHPPIIHPTKAHQGFTAAGGDDLTAVGITTNPVVGTPSIEQTHIFDAVGITTTPVVDTPPIGQEHILDAVGITTTPVVGTPSIEQTHILDAVGIITNPVVGIPSLGQTHILDAVGIATTPVVGVPTLGPTGAETLIKTFPFEFTAEGFIAYPENSDIVMTYELLSGNPYGSLKTRIFGRNKVGTSYWELSGTWEDLGIPSGRIVTQIQLGTTQNICTEYNVVASVTIGPYSIYDSTGTVLIATIWSGRSVTGIEGSWTQVPTQTYQSVIEAYQASDTVIKIRIYNTLDLGNNANAAATIYDDELTINIDHESAGGNDLTAVGIITNPVVGVPSLGQTHILDALGIVTNPVVGIPSLGQTHILTAIDITTTPVVGVPTLGSEGEDNLTAVGITTTPAVGTPSPGQTHILVSVGITTTPVVGVPTLGSEGEDNLTAIGITITPAVGTPAIGQTHILGATDIVITPAIEAPLIGQTHIFNAIGITTVPVVGIPSLGQMHILNAVGIITTPEVGVPSFIFADGLIVVLFSANRLDVMFNVYQPIINFTPYMED